MKIGINTLFMIPGEVGGTETYLCQTLSAMLRLFPGNNHVLFTNSENDKVLKDRLSGLGNVEFRCLGFKAGNRYSRILREQFQLPGFVKSSGVDVLWSPGYTAPRKVCCPQVVTIHDMQYKSHPEDMPLINLVVTDFLVKMAVKQCKRIIAVSEFSKSEVVKYTGVAGGRIDVTPEAADPVFAVPASVSEKERALSSLGLADRPYILCVSNTYPHKKVHVLVEAFERIADRIPHDLLIIGRSRLGEPDVRWAIAKSKYRDRIRRIEYVDFGNLPAIYQSAELFVFPSVYEGFGLPVLEAMIAGVPVVTVKKASIPEVGGDSAVYLEEVSGAALGDMIMDTLSWDKGRRLEWIEKARKTAGAFSWRRTATLTAESLEKAIKS